MSDLFDAMISFDGSLATCSQPDAVFTVTLNHLPSLLPCMPWSVALIDDETMMPRLTQCLPADAAERMSTLLGTAIERGLFALALRRGQAVIDELPGDQVLVLQACATPGHLAGLLLGICSTAVATADCLAAIALAAARAGAAHENLVLRGRILAHAQGLEAAVQERTRDLAAARDRAEASSRSKSSFLATVSHELRTPLNGIIGMAELLHVDETKPDRRDRLSVVRGCAEDLLRQIDGILDLSRIEAGRLDLTPAEADPSAVAMSVLRTLAPTAQAKGLELAWIPDATFPSRVIVDAGRLRQVLLNLSGNAVKFTDAGSVALRGTSRLIDGIWHLGFAVVDTGPGIAPEALAKLFNPFEQGDSSINRRFGGSGLGLTISRRLCELMSGTITVASVPGSGSTFTATVQVTAHGDNAKVGTAAAAERSALLCTDGLTGEAVAAALMHSPWRLNDNASDCEVAIVDADHADAADHISALPDDVPIALLAQLTGPPIRLAASLRSRRHRLVTKPTDPEDLHATMRELTSSTQRHERQSSAAVPAIGFTGARVLYADDQPVNRMVLAGQLKRLGVAVELASGGAEAVELVTGDDWDLILLDCQMPEVDGFMAAARIRASGCQTPLVAVTAHAMAGDREECLLRGFDDYLPKPVRPPELAAALARWIGHQTKPRVAIAVPPERFVSLRAEIGDEVFAEVLRAMLDDGPRLARESANAAAAGDLALAGRRAHALKGDAANLGLDALSNISRELEQAARNNDIAAAQAAGARMVDQWLAAEAILRASLAS